MRTRYLAAAVVSTLAIGAALRVDVRAQDEQPTIEVQPTIQVSPPEIDVKIIREKAMRDAKEAQKQAEIAIRQSADQIKQIHKIQVLRGKELRGLAGRFHPPMEQLREAAELYRDAEDEAQQAERLQKLEDLAAKLFDEDMKVREQELADVEARVQKLRSQLDRRRAKKREIIELQVKVAVNEAEGLGFTSQPRDNMMFKFRGPAPASAPAAVASFPAPTPVPQAGSFDDLFAPPTPPTVVTVASADDPLAMGKGAKGEAVRLLQRTLNEELDPSPNLDVDGDFGPETEEALKKFQRQHDLKATGVVGHTTREKLGLPPQLPAFIKN